MAWSDRPHPFTMAVAVAALIVSGISALISYRVYAANQESNRKTQESNRLAQRAFVTVQNPRVTQRYNASENDGAGHTINGMVYRFELDLVNLGNTPAYNVEFIQGAFDDTCTLVDCLRELPFALGPRDKHTIVHGPFRPNETVDAPGAAPAFHGRITYKDEFGDARNIEWCFIEVYDNDFQLCDASKYALMMSASSDRQAQQGK